MEASSEPVLHISTMGGLANQMIQYLAAIALAERLGISRLSNVNLPLWNIHHPFIEPESGTRVVTVTSDTVPADALAAALEAGECDRIDLRTYGQQMANLPALDAAKRAFCHQGPPYAGAGEDELLCSIRQGEVLDARHPDYVLLPLDWYAQLAESTGKRLVFMGQLEDTPYSLALRARFPDARFLPSRGPAADFERIRRSRHIVPSVSTFSWLAAWLSSASTIHFPVIGLFNPRQAKGTNLLPLDDARYRFTLFPIHYATPVIHVAEAHSSIRQLWRYLPAERLAALLQAPAPGRPRDLYLAAFDEAFYRAVHPDIAQAIAGGHFESGMLHYAHFGFDEGREAFALDRGWYCREYPIAAIEIAQGEYADADHHWLAIGRERGYRQGPLHPALTKT